MTFSKVTSFFILLFITVFLLPLDSMGQTSSEFDYSNHSFSEGDVLKVLEDSTYLGLSYREIILMQPKEVMEFCKKSGHSLTTVLIAQTTAESDIIEIRIRLLEQEAKMIYDDIDRKLGISQ